MKKAILLALALAIPAITTAADKDSVYAWGAWSQNIQPAAGPTIEIAPAAVSQPQVNFRPNENQAFERVANEPDTTTPVTPTPGPIAGSGIVPSSDIDVNATPGL